jgi:hypothetical protein
MKAGILKAQICVFVVNQSSSAFIRLRRRFISEGF